MSNTAEQTIIKRLTQIVHANNNNVKQNLSKNVNTPVRVLFLGLRLDGGRVESLEQVLRVARDGHDVEDEALGLAEPKEKLDVKQSLQW